MPGPNVIVFFTDQQRHDTTGVHGCPLELTPNFDRMAAQGTHLFHSFTCQPVCGPARACLQTGLYATQIGCYRNGIPLPPDTRTIAHHFNEAGYHTGYLGKWHLADPQLHGPVHPEQRGSYQTWLAANVLGATSDAYNCVVYDGEEQQVKLPGYRADALTDAAIRFMDAHQKEPFFLFVSYQEPHQHNRRDDYPAPTGYAERYTGRWTPPDLQALGGTSAQHLPGYFGMVKRLDECLGRILDALQSLRLTESTIVLYSSDHGNHFKTRNSEYKRSCHDSSLRVPTAFTGPGFDGGGQIRQLVSLLDLPPTLLDAAGIPIPPQMQGRSILPLLQGRSADWPQEVFAQISESQVGRCLRTHRWKYSVSAPDKDGVQDSCSDTYQEDYLYDLLADPYELTNLAGSETYQPVREAMRPRLIQKIIEAGEAAPEILPARITMPRGYRGLLPEDIY